MFLEATELSPENPTILFHLAVSYEALGKKEEARENLEKALNLNPRFPEAGEAKELLEEINAKR